MKKFMSSVFFWGGSPCIYEFMCIDKYACMYVCACVYVCVCGYVYAPEVYIYIYIHRVTQKNRTLIFLTEIIKFNSSLFYFSGYEVDSLHEKLGP